MGSDVMLFRRWRAGGLSLRGARARARHSDDVVALHDFKLGFVSASVASADVAIRDV